jgi:outer membrane protein assembly factor BamD (BamD/ComL family)
MPDFDDLDQGGVSGGRLIAKLLAAIGGIGVLVSLVWAGTRVWALSQSANPAAQQYIEAICWMFAGLAASILLIGQGEILGQFEAFFRTHEQNVADERSAASRLTRAEGGGLAPHTTDELVVLLREVRDISLLTEAQRSKRLEALGRATISNLHHEVPALLREHNWIEARHRIQDARARFPHLGEWDALERQIESMRSQVEQHDLEAAERQVGELHALGAWERVNEVVRELLKRHPESPRAIELAQRIRQQQHSAEGETRVRFMAQAQEATNRRDWRAALSQASSLIQRYPKSPEAQALLMQLPTLRENAEIQTRQQMEQQYAEMIRTRRFGDALRAAREMIATYPNSPQAEIMRQQLPRLEQRVSGAR